MMELAPGLREEWARQAADDPVTTFVIGLDSSRRVLVFLFNTAKRAPWAVLEQPTSALKLARSIMESAVHNRWKPSQPTPAKMTKLDARVHLLKSRAWLFDTEVILTFQMSSGLDHSYMLPSNVGVRFAQDILRIYNSGGFVDLSADAPPQAQKH